MNYSANITLFFLFTIIVMCIVKNKKTEMFKNSNIKLKNYVINLDKDRNRYKKFLLSYHTSDITIQKLNRFSAIVGQKVDPYEWLTSDSLTELHLTEKNGYRIYHHSLTRGAIGCFLSHYYLAKNLLFDISNEAYLIFEDDTTLLPMTYSFITDSIKEAPNNWDYLIFYTIHAVGESENKLFNRLKSFWGMNCYVVNKKGAQKLVNEVEKYKIDGQIDSYLSKMAQQNKLNIYSSKFNYAICNSQDTNIQISLKAVNGIDPFNYNGFKI